MLILDHFAGIFLTLSYSRLLMSFSGHKCSLGYSLYHLLLCTVLWGFSSQVKFWSPFFSLPHEMFKREKPTRVYFLFCFLGHSACFSHHAEWPHSGASCSYISWLTAALASRLRRIFGCQALTRGELSCLPYSAKDIASWLSRLRGSHRSRTRVITQALGWGADEVISALLN